MQVVPGSPGSRCSSLRDLQRFQQPLKRGPRIALTGHGAAEDDVVGAGRERFARRRNTLLIVERLVGEADSGSNDLECWIDDFSNDLNLARRANDAVDAGMLGEQ